MAATAGSVAVGSTIGHGISSMLFGGGGNAAPTQEASAAPPVQQQQQSNGISCEAQAKEFTKCFEQFGLPSCEQYLEQLKACQAAAAPY
ncbi:Mitochondrial intermembrane space cysteine motif-containing protein MIC17 [Leucoagaricus sp. SymC.cos]|nr:Mitochondrial intermembrane space cysteine motif-containing protein MIC17 [Leucoagaricus sp. SymC.cos]